MEIERFWQLIDAARAAAGPQADQAVRDVDDPDEPDADDRDYWDFDEEELEALVEAARTELGEPGTELDEDGDYDDGDHDDGDHDDGDYDDGDYEDGDLEDDLTDPVAVALFQLLVRLPAAEIADFDNTFEDVRARAETPELLAAATLIEHGLMGGDGFDDFRAGLVALGRETYERALADPDSLADHPVVREIATARDPRWFGREDVLFVASHAYAEVTGEDAVTFFEFAESLRDADSSVEVAGGPAWDLEDEARTRSRLPRLSELFYERSMRNRRRALQKLGLPR